MKSNKFFEDKKGWGKEVWFWNSEKFCYKHLYINKGKKCSWHYHKIKDEVFYLQSGKMIVKFSEDDDILTIREKMKCYFSTSHGPYNNHFKFSMHIICRGLGYFDCGADMLAIMVPDINTMLKMLHDKNYPLLQCDNSVYKNRSIFTNSVVIQLI